MGRILHTIDGLPPPLVFADERTTIIPRDGRLCIPNRGIPPRGIKLLFFLHADLKMTIGGDPPIRIRTGDILVIPRRVMQVYRPAGRTESRNHTLRILVGATPPGSDPLIDEALAGIRHLPCGMTPRHHELVKKLRAELNDRRPGYRLAAGALCLDLATDTLRSIHNNNTNCESSVPDSAAADPHIRRAKEFILENYEKPLRLEDIAWSARLSKEYLSTLFHEVTGITVFEYLVQLRVEAAKSHLCDTSLLVNQVAALSGFTSDALFCRTFKRVTGLTPSIYRRRILEAAGFEAALRYQPVRGTDTVPEMLARSDDGIRAAALARRVEPDRRRGTRES